MIKQTLQIARGHIQTVLDQCLYSRAQSLGFTAVDRAVMHSAAFGVSVHGVTAQ